MKLRKKLACAAVAAAAVVAFAVPAAAGTFTTKDQVLTVTTPDDTWQEIHDPNTWVTLGNGKDTITLLHYSNGEALPAMSVAGDKYLRVYQTVLSTQNEVFVITGSAVDATSFPAVRKAVESATINIYDTKTAVVAEKNQKNTSDYAVVEDAFERYVASDGLNVRAGYSADAERIGGYDYGDLVYVTGVVTYKGDSAGWYRVSYDGETGYVASQFLTSEQPEVKEDTTPKKTGNEMTLYSSYGTQVEIYEYSDGCWYTDWATDGRCFVAEGAGQWVCEDGSQWTTNAPAEDDYEEVSTGDGTGVLMLTDASGNTVTIYEMADGRWTDADSRIFEAEGAGQWSCSDGSSWSLY